MGAILKCSVIYLIKNKEIDNWIPHIKSLGITITMQGNLIYFFSSLESKIYIKTTFILRYMTT